MKESKDSKDYVLHKVCSLQLTDKGTADPQKEIGLAESAQALPLQTINRFVTQPWLEASYDT